jgi:hypothetical protein
MGDKLTYSQLVRTKRYRTFPKVIKKLVEECDKSSKFAIITRSDCILLLGYKTDGTEFIRFSKKLKPLELDVTPILPTNEEDTINEEDVIIDNDEDDED